MIKADLQLITDHLESASRLQKHLGELGTHNVKLHHVDHIDVSRARGEAAIIFDCKFLAQQRFSKLLELRKRLNVNSTLILAKEIPIETYRHLYYLPNTAAIQKPFPLSAFDSAFTQLQSSGGMVKNSFPRFETDQPIRLVDLRSGLLIPSRMRNYSVGGAFLEYKGISLRPGDRVQIGFAPNEHVLPQNSVQLKARVIWLRGKAKDGAERGVGVQFIGRPSPITNLKAG